MTIKINGVAVSEAALSTAVQDAAGKKAPFVELTDAAAVAAFAKNIATSVAKVAKDRGDVEASKVVEATEKLLKNGTIALPVRPSSGVPHIDENFKAQAIDSLFADVRATLADGGMPEAQLEKIFGSLGDGTFPVAFGVPSA